MQRIEAHDADWQAWLEMPDRAEWLVADYAVYASAFEQAIDAGDSALLAKVAGVLALIASGRVRCSLPGLNLGAPQQTPVRGLGFLLRVADALERAQQVAVREVEG